MEILSQLWSFLGLMTVLQNVLPTQLLSLLHSLYDSLQDLLSPYAYVEVPEFNGYCGVDINHLYRHVTTYLNSVSSAAGCRRLTALGPAGPGGLVSFSVAANHSVRDAFRGHALTWTHHVEAVPDSLEERRSFTLRLPKRSRRRGAEDLLSPYLRHVASRAEEAERLSRDRRLFTNTGASGGGWASVPFRHPSTFETLALEPSLRTRVIEDLTAFSSGREFYKGAGRAWKRGYLLHGPPGTGKSSLIAAMANFLRYDVYDLELTKVSDNSELRALLIQTTNRSVIVIEDIDCSADLITADRALKRGNHNDDDDDKGGGSRVTLSGLLNFTDGLWSCCGEERIIVFTTNHLGNVDPALLRCGRMDVHVSLGACGPAALRVLARNYLGVAVEEDHPLLQAAAEGLTPAEVGEIMLRKRADPEAAMREVAAAATAKKDRCRAEEGRFSPDSVLARGSPENWESSLARNGKKRKVKFLVRLRSLTKSDSGRR